MHIGPLKFMAYASTGGNPGQCRTILYDYMHALMPHLENELAVYDEHNQRLPQLMCSWLKGTISGHEALETVKKNLEHAYAFANRIEKSITHAIAHVIFCPETFIKTRTFINEGLDFVRYCKRNGHAVYILSNWDAHSFDLLQQKHPEFTALFDGAIISGKVGLLKPDPAIYRHLLSEYNIDIEQCMYIDDQEENIRAATQVGITSIVCPKTKKRFGAKPDFASVRRAFDLWHKNLEPKGSAN
jgi:HAD superfamily hydrolase (TIGR01549 family)